MSIASVFVAFALLAPAAPPVNAPVNVNVNVGPIYARPYYYRPFRQYGAFTGDATMPYLPPTIPSYYGGAVQYPGITIPPSTVGGTPQVSTLFGNTAAFPGVAAGPNALGGADVDKALRGLDSPQERERIDAIVTLGQSKSAKAVEPLAKILTSDPVARVRDAAARALGVIGSPAAVRALLTAAQSDGDRDVRHSAEFAAEMIRAGGR